MKMLYESIHCCVNLCNIISEMVEHAKFKCISSIIIAFNLETWINENFPPTNVFTKNSFYVQFLAQLSKLVRCWNKLGTSNTPLIASQSQIKIEWKTFQYFKGKVPAVKLFFKKSCQLIVNSTAEKFSKSNGGSFEGTQAIMMDYESL